MVRSGNLELEAMMDRDNEEWLKEARVSSEVIAICGC